MNTLRLRWLAKTLPKRNNKWFAALEQSGLSASNFLYSLLIIRYAGVAELGVYSFWFVVCQFMLMLTIGLATRQMVLQLSSDTYTNQVQGFAATCRIVAALQFAQSLLLAGLIWAYAPSSGAGILWLSLAFYSSSLNFAELFRQYFYLRSRQRYSLFFSGISIALGALFFLLVCVTGTSTSPEFTVFWFLGFGNVLFVILSARSSRQRASKLRPKTHEIFTLVQKYWKPGIPATGGMLVTWMQNQSVTPLLMFMFGPLAVGYYSVARMVVTPVNMVTTGLAKSALPQIRRAFGAGNSSALTLAIKGHCRTSMNIVYGYVLLVGGIWILGRVFGFFASKDVFAPLFLATVLVMMLSNYRFWVSQEFVVRMRFATLLRLGVVASSTTVLLMLASGLVLKSAVFVVLSSAAGEIYLILSLRRKQKHGLY